jgi:hypothetical protein
MDGGEREKEGVARKRHAVKESKARRAALHASQRRENRRKGYSVRSEESPVPLPGESAFPIIPTYADATSDEHMPGLTPDVSSYLDDYKATTVTPAAALTQPRPNGTPYPGPSAIHDLASLNLVPVIGEEEDEQGSPTPPKVLADHRVRLLMHFLDYVFPMEFSFYKPSIFEGGRGWLLSLLIRTKPLYHAALSVSAYHHSALYTARNLKCKMQTWNELQIHHTLALKELHEAMQEIDRGGEEGKSYVDGRIDALASIAQMISFEVRLMSS